jgi:ABC-2 type transport system ATP-binding protein
MAIMNVIQVEELRKYYGPSRGSGRGPSTGSGRGPAAGPGDGPAAGSGGTVKAVDGISFEVHQGEIFGFLGPNGAGKTTTIEIIEGYRRPDQGRVRVLGLEPGKDRYQLAERTGIMLQETALYKELRVGELLRLFASYYHKPVNPAALLEMIGLEEKKNALVRELSGGQRQRVVFVLALINDPELLFLDEPTAGLDPQSRRAIWDWIGRAKEEGKTVFLTTHYIEEAEALCNRVAIIDHGKIIALDTPRRLMASARIEHRIAFLIQGQLHAARLEALPGVTKALDEGHGAFTIYTPEVQPALRSLLELAESNGFTLRGLTVEGPSLEDVFIQLTGRRIRT